MKTICFGIVGCFVLLFSSVVYGQTQATPSAGDYNARAGYTDAEITTVSLCDLLKEPARFSNQLIRVRGMYHWGFEQSSLSDPACQADSLWVVFSPRYKEWTAKEVRRRYERMVEPKQKKQGKGVFYSGGSGDVMFVGYFSGPQPVVMKQSAQGYEENVPGYGHQNGQCCQLGVVYVEELFPQEDKAKR